MKEVGVGWGIKTCFWFRVREMKRLFMWEGSLWVLSKSKQLRRVSGQDDGEVKAG